MQIEGDNITFSSGHTAYTNGGIIGIDSSLEVSHGYDGGFDDQKISAADCVELADFMIARWNAFRAKYDSDTTNTNKG